MVSTSWSQGAAAYQWYETQKDTRIDLLLALYDAAVNRLERVREMLTAGAGLAAAPLLLEAQYAVYAVAEGCADEPGEVDRNVAVLLEYCLHCLGIPTEETITSALKTLVTLREGFEEIREQAAARERSGGSPALEDWPTLDAWA